MSCSQGSLSRRHAQRSGRLAQAVWRRHRSRRCLRRFGPFHNLAAATSSASMPTPTTLPKSINVARLVQNERILQGMPDGVVLLDNDNTILWGNGRLREWTGRDDVVGANFYDVMGTPEILGPDFCPFHTALATGRASGSTLRCFQNRYMRVHAAPVIDAEGTPQTPGRHDSRSDRRGLAAAEALRDSPGRHRAGRPDARRSCEDVGRGADRAVAGQHPALHAGCFALRRRRNPHARSENEDSRTRAGRRHDASRRPSASCAPIRPATA